MPSAPRTSCRPGGKRAPAIARSRSAPRRAAVLLAVHLLFALHLAHLWWRGETLSPLEPSEAMEFSKRSIVNAGLLFFAAMLLATLVFGRFFCGWGCHLLALQDLCRALLLRIGIRPQPLRSRLLAIVPLAAALYMFVWPLAYRLWIGDSLAPRGVELSTSDFWATFPRWGVALLTFAVCGFAVVYFLGSKGFCTYACPYGAFFGALDRLAPGRIRVSDACEGCGHCTAVCSSNVQVAREVRDFGMVVDPGCMKCLDCVSVCPKGALSFGFGRPALGAKPRREPAPGPKPLPWGEELLLGAVFVAAFASFRGLYHKVPFLLSLGIAGIVAFVALQLARLFWRERVRIQGVDLKAGGELRPAGKLWLAAGLAFLPFWGHAAWIRYHDWRGAAAFERLAPLRAEPPRSPAGAAETADAQRVLEHTLAARRVALLADPLLEQRLAWASAWTGAPERFVEHWVRARELGLADAHACLEAARLLERSGERELARREYEAATRVHAAAPYAHLARLSTEDGELEAALAVLDGGVEALPRNAGLQHDRALLLAALGRAGEAAAALRAALAIEPGMHDAREKLGQLLALEGRGAELVALLEEGVEATPREARPRLMLAQALIALEDLEGARAALLAALELDAGLAEAHGRLAAVLAALGDGEGARRHREAAMGPAGGAGTTEH